jgi:hypothetical protein
MKLRNALHVVIGTVFVSALVYFASSVVAGRATGFAGVLAAQEHSPILWIFDVTGAGLIALICFFAFASSYYQRAMEYQAGQYLGQINEMIERMSDMEQATDACIDRVEQVETDASRRFHDVAGQMSALEQIADTRREVFEMEMRRTGETAVRKMQDQLDSTADQVEAITATLQFHRGELRRLRQQVRELQIASPRTPALAESHREQRDRATDSLDADAGSLTAELPGVADTNASDMPDHAIVAESDNPERESAANGSHPAPDAGSNGHSTASGKASARSLRRARLSVEGASAADLTASDGAVADAPKAPQFAGRKSRR